MIRRGEKNMNNCPYCEKEMEYIEEECVDGFFLDHYLCEECGRVTFDRQEQEWFSFA
jgi:uncharacterized protein with PIN domain